MVMGNALWHLVTQSDAMSKLVLLLLLIMSIVCWAIFFYKLILVRAKKKQLSTAIAHMKGISSLEQMSQVAANFSGTMPGYFLSRAISFLREVAHDTIIANRVTLTDQQWMLIQETDAQIVDDMMYHEESYLSLISTSAAIATLLGLFGTIWGLIHSFVRISELKSADILTVAPGIAEALITTLVGLMVAIPAMVMYNCLSTQNRHIEQRLITLADRYHSSVQKLFMR